MLGQAGTLLIRQRRETGLFRRHGGFLDAIDLLQSLENPRPPEDALRQLRFLRLEVLGHRHKTLFHVQDLGQHLVPPPFVFTKLLRRLVGFRVDAASAFGERGDLVSMLLRLAHQLG